MTDSDLAFASIEQLGSLFRKRKLSPVELTRFMLARIEQLNASSTTTSRSLPNSPSRKPKKRKPSFSLPAAAKAAATAGRFTAFPFR